MLESESTSTTGASKRQKSIRIQGPLQALLVIELRSRLLPSITCLNYFPRFGTGHPDQYTKPSISKDQTVY